jgi:hypothetical protein
MATNEELQEQLDSLREEMRLLRAELRPDDSAEAEAPRGLMSRRNLLRAAPIAAIGGAIAAMSATPAAAATGGPFVLGQGNHADTTTELDSALVLDGDVTINNTFSAISLTMPGVDIDSGHFTIQGEGGGTTLQVFGGSGIVPGTGPAIVANASGQVSVTAIADDAHERFADGYNLGTGLVASAERGSAIEASSSDPDTTTDAVTIDYQGASRALYAQSHNPTNINGTVTGVNEGHGIGVWGEQRNNTGTGFGVVGVGGALGRGARLSGGAAALQLLPSTAATHPSTGKVGDFFVDASARLWYCQKASTASVSATWKQLA